MLLRQIPRELGSAEFSTILRGEVRSLVINNGAQKPGLQSFRGWKPVMEMKQVWVSLDSHAGRWNI